MVLRSSISPTFFGPTGRANGLQPAAVAGGAAGRAAREGPPREEMLWQSAIAIEITIWHNISCIYGNIVGIDLIVSIVSILYIVSLKSRMI